MTEIIAENHRVPTALRGLRILELLQWGKSFTTAELAAELGVSTSAIRKYITQIRTADIKIKSGPGFGGCYWLERGERIYPYQLTQDEMELIILGLAAFSAAGDPQDPRVPAARTLRQSLTEFVPKELEERTAGFLENFQKKITMMASVYQAKYGDKYDHLWA